MVMVTSLRVCKVWQYRTCRTRADWTGADLGQKDQSLQRWRSKDQSVPILLNSTVFGHLWRSLDSWLPVRWVSLGLSGQLLWRYILANCFQDNVQVIAELLTAKLPHTRQNASECFHTLHASTRALSDSVHSAQVTGSPGSPDRLSTWQGMSILAYGHSGHLRLRVNRRKTVDKMTTRSKGGVGQDGTSKQNWPYLGVLIWLSISVSDLVTSCNQSGQFLGLFNIGQYEGWLVEIGFLNMP